MASAKEIKAFGVSDQHSSPSVKSGSSRATKASKLEQLEREQALQMELLHAEMTAKMAKLKLSQAKQLNQLAEELGLPATTYCDAVPQLLIGLEDVTLMEPLETRSGDQAWLCN
uniref:Uncharacterized protein n=1 Tax=Anopheles atroparvus TaxID=41427 RepID=A0A182J5Q4_ANOAO